jgi:hypothetical protein
MVRLVQLFAGMLSALVFGLAGAAEVVIDFESPEIALSGTSIPGNTYAASGVNFSTVLLNLAPVVGELRSLDPVNDLMRLYEGNNAVSGDQFAGPDEGGGANDLLMHFSTPITQISVVSDQTQAEISQIIRLIALSKQGADYLVLGFVEGDDAAIGLPASLLELDLGGASFSDVLFEVTTEQEGFDDLTFTTVARVSEPTTLVLLGAVAFSGLLAGRRRRRRGG